MAKTGIWLRGARGKLAGNVLFKGENATIIRENVTPRNPQSAQQMLQRVAFATVSQAAKFMLPVIGQTFQGAGNEKENRRQFIKENVNKLRRAFDRYNGVTAGTAPLFPDYTAANPKGIAVLVPNRYVMSRGQLTLPQMWRPDVNVNPLTSEATFKAAEHQPNNTQSYNYGEALNPLDLLTALTGLTLGQQLTISAICTVDGSNVADFNEEYPDFARYTNFASKRLVVINDEDAAADASINISADTTEEQIWAAVKSLIDLEKSDDRLVAFFEDYIISTIKISAAAEGSTKRSITYGFEVTDEDPGFDYIETLTDEQYFHKIGVTRVAGISVILSEPNGGAWMYSSSEMAVLPKLGNVVTSNNKYYGYDYLNAYKTYVKQADNSSQLYTRRGGLDNSVG